METISIAVERIGTALDLIKSTDGTLWEAFANSFLASEFAQLRPVGGMHDAGRDAFLYEPDNEPGIYIQHSVQKTFEVKIRDTIRTLRGNGFAPQMLIFCSPHDIIKSSDAIKRELRLLGISLDVRDKAYFTTFRNTTAGRVSECEELAKTRVDPVMRSAAAVTTLPHALNELEERTAIAYFQISIPDRATDKSLGKR